MALSNGGYWGQWTAEAALHSGGVEELEWQRRMGAVRDRGGRGGGSSLASAGVRLLLLPPPVHGCPPYKLVQAQGQSRIYWDRGRGEVRERGESEWENLIGGSHWFFSIKMCWLLSRRTKTACKIARGFSSSINNWQWKMFGFRIYGVIILSQ